MKWVVMMVLFYFTVLLPNFDKDPQIWELSLLDSPYLSIGNRLCVPFVIQTLSDHPCLLLGHVNVLLGMG